MKIRTVPGYERYGIDTNGIVYSLSKREGWRVLSQEQKRFTLHKGKEQISITKQKLIYCAEKGVNPKMIDGRQYVILRDGKLATKAELACSNNRTSNNESIGFSKLEKTIEMARACIDYLRGDKEKLLFILRDNHEYLINLVAKTYRNRAAVEIAVLEAEEEMVKALIKGRVTDPLRWVVKRAQGRLKDMKYRRIYDCSL